MIKNYIALFRGLGFPTAYLAFRKIYKENLDNTMNSKKNGKEIDSYDINNTAVLVGISGKEFELNNGKDANLKIIGLEKNINHIENELKLKEFQLIEIKN